MHTLIYDGTFEGLLTAVFEIYQRRLGAVLVKKTDLTDTDLFGDVVTVGTSEPCATRVLAGLKRKLSASGVQRLYVSHMSEIEGGDDVLVGYMRHVFNSAINIEEDYTNKYVVRLSEIVKKIRREKHRMEAFVRFQKLKDHTYFASMEPDFNVLPLVVKHFRKRYADQKWILYDLKRKYGVHYDLHETQYIKLDFEGTGKNHDVVSIYEKEEVIYQDLWKNYFKSVNIASRKNTRLHLRHIPLRYWKHLTEKI